MSQSRPVCYNAPVNEEVRKRGAGGTSGGIGEFFLGCGMTIAGGYLLLQQISVSTSFWRLWGHDTSGATLFPFLIGVGLLFVNGRSRIGWLLTIGSLVALVSGVLFNLRFHFHSTSLFSLLVILVLLAGGLGLIVRSLREHPE